MYEMLRANAFADEWLLDWVQMHARVYGHLLGDDVTGGQRAGELGVRGPVLRADPSAEEGIAPPRRRSCLLHRQTVHTADTLHWHLSLHQFM